MAGEGAIVRAGDGAQHAEICQCTHCGLDHDFELPVELVRAAHMRQVVIFAGAGISTEVPTVFPQTVYQRAVEMLQLDEPGSFPEVIEAFVKKFGRREFIQMVRAKFDYVDSFWTLRYYARRFHQELAAMPYLEDIVTTNWDTYFEEECAAIPFVTGDDIALWKMPGRRVLKIHGSMTNLGSIVATESDYKRSLKSLREGVLGGLLTELLATRTLVFVGYSLKDWNFRRLYKALLKDMGQYAEPAYFVSPFGADEDDVKEFNLITLKTSGVKFLQELKRANLGVCFIDEAGYARVAEYDKKIRVAEPIAKTVPHKKYPAVLYCWSFHDGARDACRRILLRRASGEYLSRQHVVDLMGHYDQLADNAWDEGRYWDHSYIVGYQVPLLIMLDDRATVNGERVGMEEKAPVYYMYGSDDTIYTLDEFRAAVKASKRRAPKQRQSAREHLAQVPEDMILNHGPFLPGLPDENLYAENEHADSPDAESGS
ncbi:SIR2 family protein [Mycolicibacterium smegmatis]|nr:SIR2 family protein [Mycolicibacterium smegmatis]MDF1909716.1 SIR2 family protein [Mycolicibacterium smegmatis]MDF1921707.1 SIR2 family protein [Mycolicibacterium smegmatis]MDF1928102.1 SIR2 family protein [Mycolicibacterium smegmatis]UGT74650.1 SIR2 family protein [Mycolicibacterium smegmatis]